MGRESPGGAPLLVVLRILHVAATYFPAIRYGGTIVSVRGLAKALAQRGHDVEVFTTTVDGAGDLPVAPGVPQQLDGVSVTYFPSPRLRRLFYAPDMRRALRARAPGFDVIHTHAIYLWPMWVAAAEARRAHVPYVVSLRGMLEKELIEKKSAFWKAVLIGAVERRNIESAAAIHVTSERELRQADAFGLSFPRFAQIPNGVECEEGSSDAVVNDLVPTERFALFLGRINWKKGLDRLLAAMPHVSQLRLVIAGNDDDGLRSSLERLAAQLGVSSRVTFVGEVSGADKQALLGAASALVLPSYSENFGNVVLEAMAAGTPAIVTPEVGASDIVRASGGGIVCGGDPLELAAALNAIVSDDGGWRQAGAAAKIAAQAYCWPRIAAQMEKLYEEVQQ